MLENTGEYIEKDGNGNNWKKGTVGPGSSGGPWLLNGKTKVNGNTAKGKEKNKDNLDN